MHPNPIFHDADAARNLAFARERAFGVLAVNGPDGPSLSHIPFLLNDTGDRADLHLLRSNPIARMSRSPQPARIAVSGGDTYVSPDWYGVADQVPTWNYVAVHLTGTIELRPATELHALLDRQSAFYENRLLPKPPWTTSKMTPDVLARLMRSIVPCHFHVTEVQGTWKLGQNKQPEVRQRAADHVEAYGFGNEARDIGALMRGLHDRAKPG